jgi:hypothetical protein
MNSYERIFEEIKSPATRQKDADDAAKATERKTAASRLAKSGDTEKREAHLRTLRSSLRQKQRTQGATASIAARYGRDKPHPLERQQIAASTETQMNSYDRIYNILTEGAQKQQ